MKVFAVVFLTSLVALARAQNTIDGYKWLCASKNTEVLLKEFKADIFDKYAKACVDPIVKDYDKFNCKENVSAQTFICEELCDKYEIARDTLGSSMQAGQYKDCQTFLTNNRAELVKKITFIYCPDKQK